MKSNELKTGGEILVNCLRQHGGEHVFCVPGESYLAVLDALHDVPDMKVTVCRQEGGAAMMADAYGKLTGEPGLCFVTRGPGAANATAGLHIAQQDSTPMILFIGQVARGDMEREAFQEIDYRRMYGEMAKWVAQIDDAERIPEFISRAYYTATSGRPGPVVLALPEDMLCDTVRQLDSTTYQKVEAHPGDSEMERLQGLLGEAERPLVLVGDGKDPQTRADLESFVESWDLPVGAVFRRQDCFDNMHDNYVGDVGIGINPALAARVREADLLLVLGARLGEMTTSGYSLVDIPQPQQKLVHVYPGAEELGRVYQPELAILASMRPFARALAKLKPASTPSWQDRTRQARQEYLAWSEPPQVQGPLQMGEIMDWLRTRLPRETVVCNGAGNYAGWVHRFHRYSGCYTQLAPTSGSMGYGTPAAVAAKRAFPVRPVVAFAGDGCFMMHGQELATAMQYELPIIVIVVNNEMYGTIRMHQEREYPGRVSATALKNPQFADLARAYGAHGELVERTEEFKPAFERAWAAGRPALIELRLDSEVINPAKTLSQIRAEALERMKAGT
ncbi:thiamine pyrophosphate-binding protein [Fodinicurvata fenggangensis]|uniref:thiamine pyrophosphate-binding protein n=1 Tax=Fodinicurvata fenggangensis TaxID=1121830 RepID=UPI000B258538|nr:thiamine pyrophosphate-binding protein [Fodinicurvata fenggangensis]